MCGFVGFFSKSNFRDLSPDLISARDKLKHRGPDGADVYQDPQNGMGLGHCRLSIIDLSDAGIQPMVSSDGRTVVAYNGELYNFKDLRKKLIERGCQFKSQSDTEVVLYAYKEWGQECLSRFIGMFAFAIWDQSLKRIFLARDRLGIKPLFYYQKDDTILFASELKALMAFRSFPKSIDSEALSLYLHYQYVPSPKTIFENTQKLPPGAFLFFDGTGAEVHKYWKSPDCLSDDDHFSARDESCYLSELDNLLTQAVSDRLVSDVPLGALLSGGIDSSLVVALMQKVNTSPVRTFSIGFSDQKYNEAHGRQKLHSISAPITQNCMWIPAWPLMSSRLFRKSTMNHSPIHQPLSHISSAN